MPNGMIESKKQLDFKVMYGRADGMLSSLESMVVCDNYLLIERYIPNKPCSALAL
jgi:hypothetical protein